jgi:hypothetical protein
MALLSSSEAHQIGGPCWCVRPARHVGNVSSPSGGLTPAVIKEDEHHYDAR